MHFSYDKKHPPHILLLLAPLLSTPMSQTNDTVEPQYNGLGYNMLQYTVLYDACATVTDGIGYNVPQVYYTY